MKAILINPFDETVKEVEYTGDYREIYSLIECRTFDCVRLTEIDDMYIDDEGLLINDQRYFSINGNNYAGKGLLLSHNGIDGETTATTFTLQDAKNKVQWLPKGHIEQPYMEFTVLK